jgi:hypothetical protein
MPIRFNHMELTLPQGSLDDEGGVREDIRRFYSEVFGFESIDVPILDQNALLIRTDPETSQFILLTQMAEPLQSPSFDHLGFLYDSRTEVDEILERCEKFQARDDRVQIKYYDDLEPGGGLVVHAFYVRYILPIYFDVQVLEYAEGSAPEKSWIYG